MGNKNSEWSLFSTLNIIWFGLCKSLELLVAERNIAHWKITCSKALDIDKTVWLEIELIRPDLIGTYFMFTFKTIYFG